MRTGTLRNFCNGDASPATLNQNNSKNSPFMQKSASRRSETTEEIMKLLELEDNMAAKSYSVDHRGNQGRIPCAGSSDIPNSVSEGLNQRPHHPDFARENDFNLKLLGRKAMKLPQMVGGQSVFWCKPGVVARLMGLEAVPVPTNNRRQRNVMNSIMTRRKNLWRRVETHEVERSLAMRSQNVSRN